MSKRVGKALLKQELEVSVPVVQARGGLAKDQIEVLNCLQKVVLLARHAHFAHFNAKNRAQLKATNARDHLDEEVAAPNFLKKKRRIIAKEVEGIEQSSGVLRGRQNREYCRGSCQASAS